MHVSVPPDLTKRDISGLLSHYKGLTPKSDKFSFNDGGEAPASHCEANCTWSGQPHPSPVPPSTC